MNQKSLFGPHSQDFAERIQIGPVNLAVKTPESAAISICQLAREINDVGRAIHLVNAYTIALIDKDPAFRRLFDGPAINLPDGKPVTWIGKYFKRRHKFRQIRGPQLFQNVCDFGREFQIRHYLLGSTPDVLSKMQQALHHAYPGIQLVGCYSPPFGDTTSEILSAQDARIADADPDIVWVGLGTPKQDFEVVRLAERLPVVAIAVGAAFDFTAGTAKQAPRWLQHVGLEWLFRLACEPRRLWRRYLIGNFEFIRAVAKKRR